MNLPPFCPAVAFRDRWHESSGCQQSPPGKTGCLTFIFSTRHLPGFASQVKSSPAKSANGNFGSASGSPRPGPRAAREVAARLASPCVLRGTCSVALPSAAPHLAQLGALLVSAPPPPGPLTPPVLGPRAPRPTHVPAPDTCTGGGGAAPPQVLRGTLRPGRGAAGGLRARDSRSPGPARARPSGGGARALERAHPARAARWAALGSAGADAVPLARRAPTPPAASARAGRAAECPRGSGAAGAAPLLSHAGGHTPPSRAFEVPDLTILIPAGL